MTDFSCLPAIRLATLGACATWLLTGYGSKKLSEDKLAENEKE
jgi:hypothetical protein